MDPLPPQTPPPPPEPPKPPEQPFVSARTQLERLYSAFKNPALPLVERVRAGHQFIDLGLRYVPKEEEDFRRAMRSFRKSYTAPRFSTSIVQNADGAPVLRVFIGGSSEAVSDFPIAFLNEGLRAVQDQLHEDYYNTRLSQAVAAMLEMLTRHSILRREPMEFRPRFDFLLPPKRGKDK